MKACGRTKYCRRVSETDPSIADRMVLGERVRGRGRKEKKRKKYSLVIQPIWPDVDGCMLSMAKSNGFASVEKGQLARGGFEEQNASHAQKQEKYGVAFRRVSSNLGSLVRGPLKPPTRNRFDSISASLISLFVLATPQRRITKKQR